MGYSEKGDHDKVGTYGYRLTFGLRVRRRFLRKLLWKWDLEVGLFSGCSLGAAAFYTYCQHLLIFHVLCIYSLLLMLLPSSHAPVFCLCAMLFMTHTLVRPHAPCPVPLPFLCSLLTPCTFPCPFFSSCAVHTFFFFFATHTLFLSSFLFAIHATHVPMPLFRFMRCAYIFFLFRHPCPVPLFLFLVCYLRLGRLPCPFFS
ncbi:MAG: hypothetical protein BYD32DRAFT_193247 [Podila humilis]|nr:MAG: hypothetical protein BYD32DRAFT_193247 [Podila humilis]